MQARWQPALLHSAFAAMLTALSFSLILSGSSPLKALGIVLGAFCQLLWFVLLHECGHRTLFPKAVFNAAAGHLAAVMTVIPYYTWRDIHAEHHLWTGWKDLDPTTQSVSRDSPVGWRARAINCVWALYIPLFAFIYRLTHFWNPARCRRGRAAGFFSIGLTLMPWLLAAAYLSASWGALLLSHGLFLLLFEPIMLSQHTHIPQRRALDRKVAPHSAQDQVIYTRSLDFPAWFARWFLLNFNEHERHHAFPKVPGYFLHKLPLAGERRMHWLSWWQRSHAVPAAKLLFEDETKSGFVI